MISNRRRSWSAALGILAAVSVPSVARAEEPRLSSEPRVLREPGEVVDVVDAFDDGDPFDINIGFGFGFSSRRGTVVQGTRNIGSFAKTTAHLFPRVDIGLYKDLAFYGTLPIVLSDARAVVANAGKAFDLVGAKGETIASLPFRSPNRSGADYLALGVDAGIVNQARNPKMPTWMAGAEIRIPIGSSLHACNSAPAPGQLGCAAPGDRNRDGKQDPGDPADVKELSSGVGRGTIGIEAHSYVSRRIRFVEPYGGLRGIFEIPVGASELSIVAKAGGGSPPVEVGGALGVMFIPWENREHFGRLTFDARSDVTVRTGGADHAELFDLLGASTQPSLRTAAFTGVTRVAAYPIGKLATTALWQSSRFVKLALGVAASYAGNHAIAETSSTSPSVLKNDAGESLSVSGCFSVDLAARAVVMF